MLNRWKNKEKAIGPGSSNTLPSKGSAKKKRKTGREGGKALQFKHFFLNNRLSILLKIDLLMFIKIPIL